ncbi:hypothetical protein ACLMJK_006167 [Lecanora helva]
MKRYDRGPPKGGLVRIGIRGIAGGVGLVSESIKARKESRVRNIKEDPVVASDLEDKGKANQSVESDTTEEPPPSYESATEDHLNQVEEPFETGSRSQSPALKAPQEKADIEIDSENSVEREWDLDDAQESILLEFAANGIAHSSTDSIEAFLADCKTAPDSKHTPTKKLAFPVVLPQRRPKERSRGFVRAYAPILENCGIDQATWLAFLDSFQKSSAANPWIEAINFASFATMFIPHGIGNAVDFVIQQATKIAMELQARERTSKFLQKINEEFFRPRGLFCLVMTWNPHSVHRVEQVNLTTIIEARSHPQIGLAGFQSKYRTSDGNTFGEFEFPEVAPLVFPALDNLASQTSPDAITAKQKIAKRMKYVAEYWDKRATAEFAGKNPNSTLSNVPQAEFSSRYANPNHAAASGSLISFVSGGHLVPGPNSRGLIGGVASVVSQAIRGERQGAEWDRMRERQRADPLYNPYSPGFMGRGRRGVYTQSGIKIGSLSTPVGVYKKLVKKNVLYLMVVNMPSDEEMAAARAAAQT